MTEATAPRTARAPLLTRHAGGAVHYTPDVGRAGDTIPFFDGSRWHVFYLREVVRGITSWFHLVSDDGIVWTELGEAIPVGAPGDQDASVATGSIVAKDGTYHAFYTGFSGEHRRAGMPEQGVMRATSADLVTWTKDAAFTTLNADPAGYEPDDWRDPFVFWNDEAGEYWMLLAGRRRTGPAGRRGVVARYVSDDLDEWRLMDPFWSPAQTPMHECPDVFRWGDWWYLVYSTFDDRQVTRYRMSRSLDGPWHAPADDALDGDGLYAAKTMSDGRRRLLVGWVPSRHGDDAGAWQWGGSIVAYELRQRPDGCLALVVPEAARRALGEYLPTIEPRLGAWGKSGESWTAESGDGFAWASAGELPERGAVRLEITVDGAHEVGLGFRVDDALDAGYLVRLRPALGRLEFDRFPRAAFDRPMHERPVDLPPGHPIVLDLAWDGDTVTVVVDGVAMTARTHRRRGALACFAQEGTTTFRFLRGP